MKNNKKQNRVRADMITMEGMGKMKERDLQADLELCERATPGPWFAKRWSIPTNDQFFVMQVDENGENVKEIATFWQGARHPDLLETSSEEAKSNAIFCASAREGWPHAIRRALEAERRVAELEAEVERLRKVIGGIWSFAMERYEKADEEGYMWKNDIYGEILREIERLEKGGNE